MSEYVQDLDELINRHLSDRGDLLISTTKAFRNVARALGVVVEVKDEQEGFRLALASMPNLTLLEAFAYTEGDCLDAIDELKTMIVLMNRLLIEARADSEEARGAIEASTEYILRMRDFPIRS